MKKYAYQSHYNFPESRVIDARELEGLEAVFIGPGGVPVPAVTPAPGGINTRTGVYRELNGYTQNSLRFWGGITSKGVNLLMVGGTLGIGVVSSVLKSEDKKSGKSTKAKEKDNETSKGEISIPEEDKIPRDELDPPTKPGKGTNF